ncbi:leucine-rich repeat-containing protein 4C-like [Branchiostoma lanceolatum]|uniref:leucine-rich repeat-containing protein 4C-like n=1 Tax=Branchiostoma lanceolatum TaxID=7740 RepID=UPI003452C53E
MAPRKCSVGLREIVPLLLVLAGLVDRVMLASCPPRCVCEGDYTTVSCTNGGLQQVPKGTPYGALSLSLSGNNISGVIADQFTEFRQLQTLDLSFNMISEIEDEAFVGLESLHTLQLYYNRLTSIPTEALRRLPHLKELWLRGNPINCLDADAFAYLPNLQLLDLGELRHLEAISNDMFTGLSKLVHLNFAVANLQTVPYLGELESLEELDLSGNSIKVIENDAFSGLSKLKRLIIISSQVTEIRRFSFSPLKSLTELDLSYNNISALPLNEFIETPLLTKVNLNVNPWNCSCDIIWLVNWLRGKIKSRSCEVCGNCQSPNRLKGMSLFDIIDDDLRCGNGTKTKSAGTKVNINVMEGDDASLPCITGRTAAVSWITPNGTILRSKSFRVRVKVLEDGTLNLTRVTMHDAGSYKCIPMGNREPSSTAEVITTLNVTKKGSRKSVNTEVPLLEEPVAKDIGDMSCDTVKDTGAARNISVENSTTTVSTPSTVGTTKDGMDVDYEPDPDKDKQVDHQWIIIGSIVGIVAFGMCFWSTIFIAHRFRHRRCRHDHSRSPDDDQDDEYMVNGMVPQTSFYGLVLSEEQKPETPPPVYSIDVDDEDDCIMYHGVKTFKSDKPIKPVKTVTFKVETEV